MYQEYVPHSLLSPYIETYWGYTGYFAKREKHRILPDGCVDIIIYLSDNSQHHRLHVPCVVGTMTVFSDTYHQGDVKIAGIRFKPGGIRALTHLPVDKLTDIFVKLCEIESIFDTDFETRLAEEETIIDTLMYIENYLIGKLPLLSEKEKRISKALEQIEKTNGSTSIPHLADISCLSIRQFERKFKEYIGISPKAFSRIAKFKYTWNLLQTESQTSLFDIAIECGYYDHSHLLKDLKSLAGRSPTIHIHS